MRHASIMRLAASLLLTALPVSAQQVVFSEAFNSFGGWTLGAEWAIGPAVASSGGTGSCGNSNDPDIDAENIPGGGVAGVVIGGNANSSVLHPMEYLTSPPINTTIVAAPMLSFERWLVSDYTPFMENRVEVFDGSTWHILWQSGSSPGIQDTAWTLETYDLSPHSNGVLQVRWGFDIGSTGVWTCPSWSLDNVQICDGTCPPFGTPVFGLLMSSPYGAGSLQVDHVGGDPLAPFVTLLTPNQGNFPNGAIAGIDISPHEITLQLGYGMAPFVGTLDLGGASTFLIGPGALPVGSTLYGVAAYLDPTGSYPAAISAPVSFLLP